MNHTTRRRGPPRCPQRSAISSTSSSPKPDSLASPPRCSTGTSSDPSSWTSTRTLVSSRYTVTTTFPPFPDAECAIAFVTSSLSAGQHHLQPGTPAPYVHEVVTACHNSGRSVAVVSNNSAAAVHSYLDRHGLDDRISLVVARTDYDPALLKPSPHLIIRAVHALNADLGECTLVGDSVTDVQAAHLADIQSIGYANKPGKRERFIAAHAGTVINSLADLALALRGHVVNPMSPRELPN